MDRLQDYTKILPVNELYTAIQAEGSRTGMPTIVVRTLGCPCRCYFKEGGWCDAWPNSIHPEKGKYTFQDIINMYKRNPQIREMLLTGGSPTMHPILVNELVHFAREKGIYITMETEGSHMIETDYPINLISLSPKFSNSIPVLGAKTPKGKIVDQKFIDQHNKLRMNYDTMADLLYYHLRFQIKPVIDKELTVVPEVEGFLETIKMELTKRFQYRSELVSMMVDRSVYAMPAGDSREELVECYGPVMELCVRKGWNFTGRPHIIAYDKKRFV